MKAIFIGTLAGGFSIDAVVEDDAAEDVVVAHMANGKLVEAMEVHPATLGRRVARDVAGLDFVVFDHGLGSGFSAYGPFPDSGSAKEFAERHRGEDDEWEIFSAPTKLDLALRTAEPAVAVARPSKPRG